MQAFGPVLRIRQDAKSAKDVDTLEVLITSLYCAVPISEGPDDYLYNLQVNKQSRERKQAGLQ